jgi:serine/threonine protein kinase/tetratricopeptide (TPR) repeat protein
MIAQPPSPSPPSFGRFDVLRALAHGGMSVVYLARDRVTGEEVALKTVRVPDEIYLASLRREIHALGRLRHPGIVRILAEGVADGMPWYAMELLVGETLEGVHGKLWSRADPSRAGRTTIAQRASRADPPHGDTIVSAGLPSRARAGGGDLGRVLTLVRRLCPALAFLHGEGIVHCDLKPQNVFVRPGDLPVLMDFGLAWRAAGGIGREVAEVATKVAGTPNYMAPEQIRLQAIDPRTDLYALGCLLYELVTGSPPFVGGHEVLVRHLTHEPLPPSALVDGVPPALDELVLGLLRKRPRERIGHAEDVAAALEALGAVPEPQPPPSVPRAFVYRPELSGRDTIVRDLLTRVERPREGRGAFVLVGGESGIGKTYLATEVARRAAADLQVVAASCAPRGTLRRGGGELQPFQELFGAIADRCTAMGIETTDRLLGPRGQILAPFSPQIARLPGIESWPAPPELTGPAARELLFSALRETLAAFAREQPMLLLLDDLHWADELTLAFLDGLPPDWLDRQPLAILATYREGEGGEPLDRVRARADTHDVSLGVLDETNVRAVVRDMLAIDAPPDPFVRFLARRSGGNPFFVAEYLRAAVSEGLLRRTTIAGLGGRLASHAEAPVGERGESTSGVFERLQLPGSIRDLVGRRLAALGPIARKLATAASVIGRDFDLEILQAATGASEVEIMEGIAELLARQVVEALGPGRFQFVHDKLREVEYDELELPRRRELHRAVARAIEERALSADDPSALAGALAHHWAGARVDDKALEWLERAAVRALDHAAYRESERLHRRAIEIADRQRFLPALRRARLHAGIAKATFGSGDLEATEAHGYEALARLGHPLPRTTLGRARFLGRALVTQAAHLVGFGVGAVRGSDQRDRLCEAATSAALMSHRFFYVDDAFGMLAASLLSVNLAERAGVEAAVPRAYTQIAFVAGLLQRHRLAAKYFGRARAGAEATHDPIELAFALAVESVYHCGHGRWDAAESAVGRADESLRGVTDPFLRELVLTARGHVEFYTGRVVAAQQRFETLLASARARGSEQHATWGLFSIARSALVLDRPEVALPLLEEARDALSRRPELQSEIICHGLLADAYARLGHDTDALRVAEGTVDRIRRARPTGFAALEGYVGTLSAALALERRGRDALGLVRRVVRLLARFSRAFPIARPSAERGVGELALRRGDTARARAAFERALESARAFGMPREEAEALSSLSRLLPTDSWEQQTRRAEAEAIWRRIRGSARA